MAASLTYLRVVPPDAGAAPERKTALKIIVLHGATDDRPDEVDTLRTAESVRDALEWLGHSARLVHVSPGMQEVEALPGLRPDLVFNLVEAIGGDAAPAAEVPGRLDRLRLHYTGCDARATVACMSKLETKRTLAAAGLPTAPWSTDGRGLEGIDRVIVKADSEHASVGIDAGAVVPVVEARAEMARRATMLGTQVFAEAYIEGREFNIAVLEGPGGPQVLPLAETLFVGYPDDRPRIVDYEAKWAEDSFAYNNTPRRFDFGPEDDALTTRLTDLTLRTWDLFGLSGYARIDYRVDAAALPWILEVNTNPCIARDAGFFAAAERAGLRYETMVGRIVDAALARGTKAA